MQPSVISSDDRGCAINLLVFELRADSEAEEYQREFALVGVATLAGSF